MKKICDLHNNIGYEPEGCDTNDENGQNDEGNILFLVATYPDYYNLFTDISPRRPNELCQNNDWIYFSSDRVIFVFGGT